MYALRMSCVSNELHIFVPYGLMRLFLLTRRPSRAKPLYSSAASDGYKGQVWAAAAVGGTQAGMTSVCEHVYVDMYIGDKTARAVTHKGKSGSASHDCTGVGCSPLLCIFKDSQDALMELILAARQR